MWWTHFVSSHDKICVVFALICQFRLLFKTSLQQPGLIAAQFCTQIPELREGKKNLLADRICTFRLLRNNYNGNKNISRARCRKINSFTQYNNRFRHSLIIFWQICVNNNINMTRWRAESIYSRKPNHLQLTVICNIRLMSKPCWHNNKFHINTATWKPTSRWNFIDCWIIMQWWYTLWTEIKWLLWW